MRAGALPNPVDDRSDGSDHRLALVQQSVTTAATLAHERTLPLADGLTALVPSGRLQRGSNLAVHGAGATSLALALVGEAVRQGSFLAVIAGRSFGLGACIDFDIPLRRVVQFVVPDPAMWGQIVGAAIEGFDAVLIADGQRVRAGPARTLVARGRERGSVMVRAGGAAWPDAADFRFDISQPVWSGLGRGHGHLRQRQVAVQVAGRRHRGAPRVHQVLLPAAGGGVALATPTLASAGAHDDTEARHAGSDIDAMLDVIDGPVEAELGAIA